MQYLRLEYLVPAIDADALLTIVKTPISKFKITKLADYSNYSIYLCLPRDFESSLTAVLVRTVGLKVAVVDVVCLGLNSWIKNVSDRLCSLLYFFTMCALNGYPRLLVKVVVPRGIVIVRCFSGFKMFYFNELSSVVLSSQVGRIYLEDVVDHVLGLAERVLRLRKLK